jgi:hypothetical protein
VRAPGWFVATSFGTTAYTELQADGHWITSATLGGPVEIEGVYSIAGDQITFSEPFSPGCNASATYRLETMDCDGFTLHYLHDGCGSTAGAPFDLDYRRVTP